MPRLVLSFAFATIRKSLTQALFIHFQYNFTHLVLKMSCVSHGRSLSFRSTNKEPLQTTLQLEVHALQSTSIWLRLLNDTLVDSRGWAGLGWAGLAWAAMDIIWGRNIFLISLFKEERFWREVIFLSKIPYPSEVNWCVPKTWVLQVSSKWM